MNPISTATTSSKAKRWFVWLSLLVVLMIGLIVVITPIWLIQPFKPQSERDLLVSFTMRRISPILTVITSAVFVLLAVWLWRHTRWFAKAFLVVLAIPLFATTWMARQNHFEWMFRPHASIAYAPIGQASYVSDSDMVLTVKNNGEAVAYPVRLMAYHHLVQDVVGGTPIVATY
jgi:Protein of unknown function (DUF3179)